MWNHGYNCLHTGSRDEIADASTVNPTNIKFLDISNKLDWVVFNLQWQSTHWGTGWGQPTPQNIKDKIWRGNILTSTYWLTAKLARHSEPW